MRHEERNFDLLQKRVDKIYDEILPNINNNLNELKENHSILADKQASLGSKFDQMFIDIDLKINNLSKQQRYQLSWKIITITLSIVALFILFRI